MSKLMTLNEYKHKVKSIHGNSISVIGKYKGSGVSIKHKCNKCENIWKSSPSNITHKTNPTGCPSCSKPSKKLTISELILKINEKAPGYKIISGYTRITEPVKYECPKGHINTGTLRHLLKEGSSCRKCAVELARHRYIIGISNLRKRIRSRFPLLTLLSTEYKFNNSLYLFRCVKGHVFERRLLHLKGHAKFSGCPVCDKKINQSKIAIEFIESISKHSRLKFNHALNSTEHKIEGTNFKVDGYNSIYDISLEFHGDYWHNANLNKHRLINYIKTIKRDQILKSRTNLIVVWEYEWRNNPNKVIKRVVSTIKHIKSQQQSDLSQKAQKQVSNKKRLLF